MACHLARSSCLCLSFLTFSNLALSSSWSLCRTISSTCFKDSSSASFNLFSVSLSMACSSASLALSSMSALCLARRSAWIMGLNAASASARAFTLAIFSASSCAKASFSAARCARRSAWICGLLAASASAMARCFSAAALRLSARACSRPLWVVTTGGCRPGAWLLTTCGWANEAAPPFAGSARAKCKTPRSASRIAACNTWAMPPGTQPGAPAAGRKGKIGECCP
mmetsp:Transcript_93149/g.301157  ORF Transcript_93149/g.301157 Transcript_93149/m.301157 type:complete len:226 (-) Transcript_93149:22-699(-)